MRSQQTGLQALAAALLLQTSLPLPVRAQQAADSDGFGRWDSQIRRCQLHWPAELPGNATSSGCIKLRLDQSIEGMLRVRFINAAGGSRFASEELTFAGLLLKSDQPMRCQQGACSPSWPLRMRVHGVASRRFDARGLAAQLPSNQLAKGSCTLGPAKLVCQAKGPGGHLWKASAELPDQASGRLPVKQNPHQRP
jgi:hypothetical protein